VCGESAFWGLKSEKGVNISDFAKKIDLGVDSKRRFSHVLPETARFAKAKKTRGFFFKRKLFV